MTTTNTNYPTNNLSQSNSIFTTPTARARSSKVSNLYLGSGFSNLPGTTNIIFAPEKLIEQIKATGQAYRIKDQEGVVDNSLSSVTSSFSIYNAFLQLSWYVMHAGTLLNILKKGDFYWILHAASPLSKAIFVAGLVVCVFESVLESIGIARSATFLKDNYLFDIEQLKNSLSLQDPKLRQLKFSLHAQKILQSPIPIELKREIESLAEKKELSEADFSQLSSQLLSTIEENVYLTKLQNLENSYFQISNEKMAKIEDKLSGQPSEEKNKNKNKMMQAEFDRKKSELIRRVHPWLANQMEETLPGIIKDLQSPEQNKRTEAKEKAALIFKNIKIQSQKKLLIHIIGLMAALFTMAGIIVGCFACPFIVPFLLLIIGTALSFIRYSLHCGLLDSEGWKFSASKCIPNSVKKIYKKITSKPEKSEKGITALTSSLIFTPASFSREKPSLNHLYLAAQKPIFRLATY